MPWDLVPVAQTRWYKRPITWVGVAALVCVMLLLLPRVQARYQRWAERRGIMRAVEAFNRGDFKQAVVDARGVLKKNPRSGDATRIMAKSLEAMKSPHAVTWRRNLDSLQSGDAENLLGLAEASIKSGDFDSAARALQRMKAEDQKAARFHELSAKVARAIRDVTKAEEHWLEAVRLEPANEDFQLGLAGVQLDSPVAATRAGALAALEKLTANPAQRIAALRVLIADATKLREKSRMRELAEKLAADPAAQFSDKLIRLEILRTARDPVASAFLAELQDIAAPNLENVYRLMSWMNENNLALAVIEWEGKLPPEVAITPPVCAPLADAYARAADWKGLKGKLESATWTDMEFLRLAFLARAYERLGDINAASATWNNALAAAQPRPEWLEMLAKATRSWGWKQRTEEALWKLTATWRQPRWALEFLWAAALARKDSSKLYEVSKLFVKADPTNLMARNNNVALALLTGQTADAPEELAETLYKQNPENATIGSTYGFALFLKGKAAEAVAVMDTFKPEELRIPQVASYYGIFLAAAGQTDRADEYFQLASRAPLLPEEKALIAVLAPACRARVLDRGGDDLGSRAAWQEALTAAENRSERLELLARMAIDWQWQSQADAVVLKLASLERCPPWAGETLWKAALNTADATQIHRAGRLLIKVDPNNLEIRNRFLFLSLLTGREAESAQTQAAALARENPKNVEVAAILGLALYQQGKAEEAVALMSNFTPEQLRSPSVALYQGVFLTAVGRKDDAAPLLQVADTRPLLAEEKDLIARAGEARRPVAAAPPPASTPAPAASSVQPIDRTRRDSAQLYKEAREVMLAEPKNVLARSNYILLALLTDQSADSARQLANALYKQHPEDAAAAACQGLSLSMQGKSEEAIAVMETLKPEQLQEPVTALYYGHFLASSTNAEKATRSAEFLRHAEKVSLLPEEQAFLESAK